MSMKKGFIALFLMQIISLHATWEIKSIINRSNLSLKNTEASFGKGGKDNHGPLTNHLKKNSPKKVINVQGLDASVGKKSQGFNGFIVHDEQGHEHQINFDWQKGYRLQSGRAKKTSITVDLGKYDADAASSVARIELVKDGKVISSDVQNYKKAGTKFSIVLGQKNGNYSIKLKS